MTGVDNLKSGTKQYATLGVGVLVFLAIIYILFFGIDIAKEQSTNAVVVDEKIENAETQLPMQSIWNAKIEIERKKMNAHIESLEKKLEDTQNQLLESKKRTTTEINQMISNAAKNNHSNLDGKIIAKINALEGVVSSLGSFKTQETTFGNSKIQDGAASFEPVVNYDNEEELSLVAFNLTDDSHNTPANTIPSGSFVKAILLSGVEASTATGSSGNPRPIILELVDDASLPNNFHSKVKQCRLIGAATGDISSERVEIRLETMSCIDIESQKITQGAMSGFVSGEDGRAGIRGTVVIKDRELMMNSLFGGILGGASQAVSQIASPTSNFNPMTGDVGRKQSNKELFVDASGQGVSGALDRYAKYYIERAEMLQPVIQVSSGRIVDVIFTASFSFSEEAGSQPINVNNRLIANNSAKLNSNGMMGKTAGQKSKDFASDYLGEY